MRGALCLGVVVVLVLVVAAASAGKRLAGGHAVTAGVAVAAAAVGLAAAGSAPGVHGGGLNDSLTEFVEMVGNKARRARVRHASSEWVEKPFARAEKEGLLVSLVVTPPGVRDEDSSDEFDPKNLVPRFHPWPRPPGGILWLSKPELGGRSWYDFARGLELEWADPEEVTVVGYEVDVDKLLRVDTPEAVERFTKEYAVCPDDVDPGYCDIGALINWGRVAIDHPGVAFDPYLTYPADGNVALGDTGREAPLWYLSLDAVTYAVWDPKVVKRVVVLRRAPSAHRSDDAGRACKKPPAG